MWLPIIEAFKKHHHFVITTHIHPDGDGIGSAAALIELLRSLGKKCRFISDSPVPEKYKFLDFHQAFEDYNPATTDFTSVDALIVVDTSQAQRIGRMAHLLECKEVVSICIDHHPFEETFADISYIDPESCATGALIHSLFECAKIPMNKEAATAIYLSILCDTCRFSNSCSNGIAHKIADECIEIGVDPDEMHSRVFQHVPLAEIKIFAAALQRMETYLDDRVVVQEIRQEDFAALGGKGHELEHIDLDYILEFNKSIQEVQCIVLLRELADMQVRVSLRSKPSFDIREVIKKLGGGGHSNAAGANVPGSLKDVKKLVVSLLEKIMLSENCIAFHRSVQ